MSYIANQTPVFTLDIYNSWKQLTEEEKLYVHYLSQHVWATFPIAIKQRSVESFDIFVAILKTFRNISLSQLLTKSNVSDEAKTHFENYIATFLSNGGNYRSFGDIKFIPGCSKDEFIQIVSNCGENYFEKVIDIMFDISNEYLLLAFPPKGYTTYYNKNVTKEEVDLVNNVIIKNGMMFENTIIDKIDKQLIVRIA